MDDKTVRVVVFTGAGEGAVREEPEGGGELRVSWSQVRTSHHPLLEVRFAISSYCHDILNFSLLHFVSIAAVNGHVGCGLSGLARDIRLASENALFRGGFLTAGLSGDFEDRGRFLESWAQPRGRFIF